MDRLARIFRAESGQVLASLVYFSRDLQLAEDALQDACEQASKKWPVQGIPENTSAWLHLVAKRKLIDKLRQQQSQKNEHKLQLIEQSMYIRSDITPETDYEVPDERLRLIFTCCHPALNEAAQVALTLRALCGLEVIEIARAYLTSEAAIGQRITRAKKKIRDAGISYEIPNAEQLNTRLPSVLKVIYHYI
jgi:RNA polymerase sigma-70 factor (ECF subfamily)